MEEQHDESVPEARLRIFCARIHLRYEQAEKHVVGLPGIVPFEAVVIQGLKGIILREGVYASDAA
ncbi:hypothetical protein PpBr36_05077 [Pyricularia pennisetigena]|uniref:hypothetical protein n=1 Tax=Pyricularia pennisetigena TaxID=1578925 RepID=UPI00114F4282|nr:hypothetical protein PpBr36_05077 [Pyricularia pennisetigena]TLS26949.1 hypothetical protein PpBr36_05077 [Pyricularia pennisetigena]